MYRCIDLPAGVLTTEEGSDEIALKRLFMRIDANSNGIVDWDEFCTYMLLESQGSATLRAQVAQE